MNLLSDVWWQLLHLRISEVEFPEMSQFHDPVAQLSEGIVAKVEVVEGVALLDGVRHGGQGWGGGG